MTNKLRFYLDENVNHEVADGLRTRGIEVLTTPEAGHIGWSDPDQLHFATAEGCVIVTQDRDYLVLHHEGISHAGIVYYKDKTRTTKQVIRRLLILFEQKEPVELVNQVIFL